MNASTASRNGTTALPRFPYHDASPVEFTDALPASVDCVIVGGGVIGVSTAWYLRERGLSVLVLDKGRIAGEQSSRNWGWVRTTWRDPDEVPIARDSIDCWEQLARELGDGIGFRRAESARVTMFLHFFPDFIRSLAPWIYAIVSMGFFFVILFAGIEVVDQQIMMTERGAALDIPMWTIGISVPIAGFVGIVGIVESLILHFDRIRQTLEIEE